MADDLNRGEMPFLDHLEELRWRLLYSLLAIVLGTVAGWIVVEQVDVIGLLMRPIAPHLPGGRLNYTSPTDPFFITLKFAFIVGLVFASPVLVYHLWAFLAPALYEREKRIVMPSLAAGVLLFLAGAAGGYLLVLPRALAVLLSFQNQALQPIITADRYFGFAAQIILAFGVVTELPLVIILLTSFGVVTPAGLRRNRRYALLIAATLAAFLTPPDAMSMLMMMVPLLLLYEIGIWCSWVVSRRRARAAARAAAVATLLVTLAVVPRPLSGQQPDTTRRRPPGVDSTAVAGRPLDTAAARRLGLPSGPTRSFPAPDAVLDSLLKLTGFRVTQYVADTLLLLGGDTETIVLRGEAFVDRDGTKLEADSVHYRQASCRLDASGSPRLFDQGTVLIGEGMRYDTCIRRGSVTEALTDFQQGGATWIMRGNLAVDSGSTRLYGSKSKITSDERPVPGYHFAAGEVKWLNKSVMVARPAVLYVRDVPILWLPFIFQDIRPGRRSGILVPRFGLNDLVRPTRGYRRHVSNIGYYFVLNDYVDVLASADWFSGTSFSAQGQLHYRWLDRFVQGGLSYSRLTQLDASRHSNRIAWNHNQSFNSRTRLAANVDYATSTSVIQRNTIDPFLTTAQLTSSANFDKRFSWGTFNLGGSLSQNLSSDLQTQNLPRVSITPAPIDLASWITWSPGFSFSNTQTFHNVSPTRLLTPGSGGGVDTTTIRFDTRSTDIAIGTPLRVGRWNWSNSISIADRASNQRVEFVIPDAADSTVLHRIVYDRTFETRVDWNTGINLPQLLSGTWRLQPGLSIVNKTSAGPYMLRNQFTGGRFLQQGKRLAFSVGAAPTFFGFFPAVGPFARIRHSVSPLISYQYAPGAKVADEFARALDPTGRTLNARSDPQQTITLGLQQNFEAKFKTPAEDTSSAPRKIRLLGLSTSSVSYNFEQAKQPGRVGWQTQSLSNTFASDLLPGFNLQITHDLWNGQVGLASTRFDPFLQSLSASFAIGPRTLAVIGGLFGLGPKSPPPDPQPPAAVPGTPPPPQGGPPGPRGFGGYRSYGAGSGGRGFNLNVQFSSQRSRADTLGAAISGAGLQGGRQQMSLNMSFSPTKNWNASWNTLYDFDTRRFGQHYVRLERDLHRWHASFSFSRTASGNFAFNFYVALLDQPDIKFDYDQQSYTRP
ncbi:MAG TPA: twin-arginine translocase subunit TatC [Gemmatimonadales bacterium]